MQGAAAASILSRDRDVDEVILGDIDINVARKVSEKIDRGIVKPVKIDASNKKDIVERGGRVDLILNMAPPRFNLTIMKAAIEMGAYYVDTACGPDLDLNPIDTMVLKQIKLNKDFEAAEVAGLIACGYTPGLTDIVVRLLAEDFEVIDSVRIRVGSRIFKKQVQPPISIIINYSEIMEPTWSPEVSFLYRASPPVIYKNGRYIRCKLFDAMEEYDFPEPVGKRWNVLVDHEEPVLIPRYTDKKIGYVDYKNQPDLVAYSLIKLGFASSKPIRIGNVKVVPRDLIIKMLRKPVHMFLEENEELYMQEALPYVCEIIVIEMKGVRNGIQTMDKGIIKTYIPPADPKLRLRLFEKLGTLHVNVALPAIVGGKMIIKNSLKGVMAPESLNANEFLKEISTYGLKLSIDIEKRLSLEY